MEMQEILEIARAFDGVLVVVPDERSGLPEVAWGDAFLYYAPDGVMPARTQPYATIVTKNYPDDEASRLDEPDRYRVNIHIGQDRAALLAAAGADPAATDAFAPHPLYGTAGWVSVVNPAAATSAQVVAALRDAHEAARARASRRSHGA
jgi:hypothetical protein